MARRRRLWRHAVYLLLAVAGALTAANVLYCLGAFAGGGFFVWRSPSADAELYWAPSQNHVVLTARGRFTRPPSDWIQAVPSGVQIHKWLYQSLKGTESPEALLARGGVNSKSSTSGALCAYLFLDGRVAESALAMLQDAQRDPGSARNLYEDALGIVKDTDSIHVAQVLERLGRLYGQSFPSALEFESWVSQRRRDDGKP